MAEDYSSKRNITSQMIADLAHVSRATVYRVLRNDPRVKDEVRQRVKEIIEKYSYTPNYAGTALVKHKERVKIGAIGLTASNPLYDEMNKGILWAAEEYKGFGIEVLLRLTEDISSTQAHVDAINDLVQAGVKGLAIMGVNVPEVQETLKGIENEIPIVTFNTNISNINELCFVGQDSIKSGRTAAALMHYLIRDRKNILIIANSLTVLAVANRIQGFKDKLQEYPKSTILGVYENHNSDIESYEIISKLMQEKVLIDGIYLASGIGSGGVCQAISDYRLQNVKVIANDLLPDTVENLKNGKIAFTIGQELFKQGYLPIEILVKYILMSEKPKSKNIYTNIDIFIAENL